MRAKKILKNQRSRITTIIVNLIVNKCQFNEHIVWVGRMRRAHWQPQNNINALVGKTKRLIIEEYMIVTFRKPVEGLRGKMRLEDGFYIRKLHGKYVVQRCPNRKGHVPTEKERENQQRFIQQYRRLRRGDGSQASGSVAEGRGASLEIKGKEI